MKVTEYGYKITFKTVASVFYAVWAQKIIHSNKKSKIMLVGTDRDERDSAQQGAEKNIFTQAVLPCVGPIVKTEEGRMIAKHMGVLAYLECFISMQDKKRLSDIVKTALCVAVKPSSIFSEYRTEFSQQEEKKEKPFKH